MTRTYDFLFVGYDEEEQAGDETLTAETDELELNIEMYGYGGNDTLNGGNGNDKLDGGTGADSLSGGAGSDLYIVDDEGDTVTEEAGVDGDVDTVESSVNFTLGSDVENLTLTGEQGLTGTGNDLDNKITGSEGDDTLYGGASDSANGNDTLDGGAGADTMVGGTGDDTYVVDDVGDTVTEEAGEEGDVDTVESSINFTLGDNVENLTLTGTGSINGTGNTSDNTITGNDGDNALDGDDGDDKLYGGDGNDRLDGGDGVDSLYGGDGDDTLVADSSDDLISGGDGIDTVEYPRTITTWVLTLKT